MKGLVEKPLYYFKLQDFSCQKNPRQNSEQSL